MREKTTAINSEILVFLFLTPVPVSLIAQGKLMDGQLIDSSLSKDPLVLVLGKRTVIAGKYTNNDINNAAFLQHQRHFIETFYFLLVSVVWLSLQVWSKAWLVSVKGKSHRREKAWFLSKKKKTFYKCVQWFLRSKFVFPSSGKK